MTTTSSIGRLVRYARKRAGMTQHDLARAVRMPQPSIARIERGTVVPRTATLLAILDATGHAITVEPTGPDPDREAIRQRLALDVPHRTWLALGKPGAKDRRTSPTWILRRLRLAAVPFVLVGDLAEVAHGSPVTVGRVIEVCHAQTAVATERLERALKDLGGTTTAAGELRLLTTTDAGDDYDTLRRNAVEMLVDTAVRVRVAALDDLMRIRRTRGTPDDQAAMAVLRAIGDELAAPLPPG